MPAKHVAWSLSKAQLALNCSLSYDWKYKKRRKGFRITKGAGRIGTAVHFALEQMLLGKVLNVEDALRMGCNQGDLTVPEVHQAYDFTGNIQRFVDRFATWKERLNVDDDDVYVEKRVGITKDYTACKFFDKQVWFRGVWDLAAILRQSERTVMVITDHKTGAPADNTDKYEDQFRCYAVTAPVFFPEVTHIRCQIHYVKTGDIVPREKMYTVEEITTELRPWLNQFVAKAEKAKEQSTPCQGWWCDYCSYKPWCPLFKKGAA